MIIKLYTDGASRGNGGLSGVGFYASDEDGRPILEGSKKIKNTTNNKSEWNALIFGLVWCRITFPKVDKLLIYTDSLIVVNQLTGEYKTRDEQLKFMKESAWTIIEQWNVEWDAFHISRNNNKRADAMANFAIDGFFEDGISMRLTRYGEQE